MKKSIISLVFGAVFLVLFVGLNHVTINKCNITSKQINAGQTQLPIGESSLGTYISNYSYEINSLIEQTTKIGIGVNENLLSVKINGIEIDVEAVKRQYDQIRVREWQKNWQRGYSFLLPLMKGNNILHITASSNKPETGIRIGQGFNYFEYIILFVFSIVPIVFGLYGLLFEHFIRALKYFYYSDSLWDKLPIIIIVSGVLLRLIFLLYTPQFMYQHDFNSHVELIRYYYEYPLKIAQPDKGLEFPQQPLYYWMSSIVYAVATGMGKSEYFAIQLIRAMSVLFSIFWLVIGMKLIQVYTKNRLLINLFIAFLSFTPSFIFMSVIVGNDSLNTLLGILSLYAVSVYFISRNTHFFYLAFVSILLAMLTKISSALYAIFFVVVLLVMYFQSKTDKANYRKAILKFSIAVLFVFGLSLVKSNVPATGEFLFINSTLFDGQIIPALNLNYFMSFNLTDLISAAQSYVFGVDDIRFSLPTYLYGTMFTGEYDYTIYFKAGSLFQLSSQMIYLFGLIYISGMIAYVYFYKTLPILYKLLIIPVVINFVLIIKFLLEFWDVSNSDFRFFSPTFAVIGLIFVLGIGEILKHYPSLKRMIVIFAILLSTVEIFWIVKLMLMLR